MRSIKIITSLHSLKLQENYYEFSSYHSVFCSLDWGRRKKKMTIEGSCLLAKGSNRWLCHLQECIEVFYYRNEKPFRSTLNPPVLLYKRHLWDSYRVVNIRSILYTKTFLVKERKIHFARPFSSPSECQKQALLPHVQPYALFDMTFSAEWPLLELTVILYESDCTVIATKAFLSVLFFRNNVCNQRYMDVWGSKTYLDT